MIRIFVLSVFLSLFIPFVAYPSIINIPADYPTIQQGIDASSDGDTVLVQPGTYVENLEILGKDIVLGSMFLMTGDTLYISSTIIDGDSAGFVIDIDYVNPPASIIGFTIQNGQHNFGVNGGGIYVRGSGIVIDNNIIRDNTALPYGAGAGIYLTQCAYGSVISYNLIRDNYGGDGSGISLSYSDLLIRDNTIMNNIAIYYGGGIECSNYSDPIIVNNIIMGNSADQGGAIYISSSSNPNVDNNTIENNEADSRGGGLFIEIFSEPSIINNLFEGNSISEPGGRGGAMYLNHCDPLIHNNIIQSNSSLGSDCWGGGISGMESDAIVSNNLIRSNSGSIRGGGIGFGSGSNPIIYNNIILENSVVGGYIDGGGLYFELSNPIICNNTILNNTSGSRGGGIGILASNVTAINNIIWGNVATVYPQIGIINGSADVTFSDIEGNWPGIGNISVNPAFRDPESGDFHLMSIACGDSLDSPCIDAGHFDSLDVVLDCLHGLGNSRADMGAYGGNNGGWITNIADDNIGESNKIPQSFLLYQNYPNPFNETTTIGFLLSNSGHIKLTVYDLLGREIITLIDGYRQTGNHSILFDASNFSSGVYFYSLQDNYVFKTKKMILLK